MERVHLVRYFEQHIVPVFLSPCVRKSCPSSITRRGLGQLGVPGFVLQPARNVREEASFRERLAKNRLQLERQARSIDGFRLLLYDAADGPLLNELALKRKERREFVVTRLERLDLIRDPEQLAQKVFNVRRERDDQLGPLFVGSRPRIAASVGQLQVQTHI